MFGSLKKFALKKLVQSQLDSMPPEARGPILNLVENHPEMLMQLAQDMQAEKAAGKSDQEAMMAVMRKHETLLKGILK